MVPHEEAVENAGTGLSRRHALLATLAAAPLGCRRPRRPIAQPVGAAPPASGTAPAWGGLNVVRVGEGGAGARGGVAVVVLHGWGAPGDDLVPLAEAMRRPGVTFFVPAAPLPEMGGGRAWWHLDPTTRPPHASTDQVPPSFRPNAAVVGARVAVEGLIATIVEQHAPDRISLCGFSQGAMLSLDVALAGTANIDRVVAMSGVLLADSVPGLTAARTAAPRFFLSHGRADPVVPFASGSRAKELLEQHGLSTVWHPFDGGHEIPPGVLAAAASFLFAAS